MAEPICAQKEPFEIAVEAGKAYFWCSCGRSENQPFCDGKHAGTGLTPVRFKPEEAGTVFFCGCKATGDSPMCDGSHNIL